MKKLAKGEMTVREMARLGGLARAAKCSPEELSRIGRLGVAAMKAKYTSAQRSALLRKGRKRRRPLTEKQHARLLKLLKSGQSQTEVARALNVSRPTVGFFVRCTE